MKKIRKTTKLDVAMIYIVAILFIIGYSVWMWWAGYDGQTKEKLKKFVNNFSFTEECATAEIKDKTIDNERYIVIVRDKINTYEVEATKEEYDNAEIGEQLTYYTVSCPDIKYYYDERPTRGIRLSSTICLIGTDANKLKEQEKKYYTQRILRTCEKQSLRLLAKSFNNRYMFKSCRYCNAHFCNDCLYGRLEMGIH